MLKFISWFLVVTCMINLTSVTVFASHDQTATNTSKVDLIKNKVTEALKNGKDQAVRKIERVIDKIFFAVTAPFVIPILREIFRPNPNYDPGWKQA